MMVFWWSGRGYFTAIIILATLSAFGIILQAGRPILADRPWYWAIAFLVAAGLNWHFGTKANRKKLAALRARTIKDRLWYRARHTFMTLPMETFSPVIALFAIAMLAYGFVGPQ